MSVVGWILIVKGALFLFGARLVVRELITVHPVTFGFATRGANGETRFVRKLRMAGFLMAAVGAGLVWLAGQPPV